MISFQENLGTEKINEMDSEVNSHLFCTLISENQGLDKPRFVSNLIKISVPVHLIFFFGAPEFFSGLWYKSEKNPVDKLKKIQVY
jgi:hypothetical protein